MFTQFIGVALHTRHMCHLDDQFCIQYSATNSSVAFDEALVRINLKNSEDAKSDAVHFRARQLSFDGFDRARRAARLCSDGAPAMAV